MKSPISEPPVPPVSAGDASCKLKSSVNLKPGRYTAEPAKLEAERLSTLVNNGLVLAKVLLCVILPLPATGLNEGFQQLNIRALDDQGTWGLYQKVIFYVSAPSATLANIASAEYFFDTDPGLGNGTALSISGTPSEATESFVIPLGSLVEGFHTLAIRTQNTDGVWSIYDSSLFFVTEEIEGSSFANIAGAEYWFDTDPGLGNGTALTISGSPSEVTESFVIPLGSLELGFHSLGLRTQNTDGTWSLYDKKVFYIFDNIELDVSPLSEMEFLFDEELGYGTGQTAPIIATGNPDEYLVEIPTDLVSCDIHDIWVSVKNEAGRYSIYNILIDVDVFDNEAPTIVVFPDITVELDASGTGSLTIADVNNGTFDDCELVSVELNQVQFNYNCDNLGNNTVTITATDAEAKVSTQDVTVMVVDNINPVAIAQNITVALDENGIAIITGDQLDNGSTDNCSIVNRSVSISSFTCDNLGDNTVTFTVEDAGGNTNSTSAIVTVEDNLNPIAIGQDIIVDLANNPSVTIIAEDVNNASSDNCGSITLSIDADTFTELGEFPVVLSVEDAVGNVATVTVIVTVIDSSLSINDNTIENNSLKIHPNPTNNILYYETNSSISSFNIIDVTGKIVLKLQNPSNQIKVGQLSDGLYFIRFITDGGQSIIKRFVKN